MEDQRRDTRPFVNIPVGAQEMAEQIYARTMQGANEPPWRFAADDVKNATRNLATDLIATLDAQRRSIDKPEQMCGRCTFWAPVENRDYGKCRKKPPHPKWGWPEVYNHNGCGKWKQRKAD